MREEELTPSTPAMIPEAIISLVTELEGVGATELPPLASVVDPDALVALFDSADRSSSVVEFDYAGYRIVVRGDGDVHALEATPTPGLCNAD